MNINISQKNPQRGVLGNSCSEICDQNPGKIPMKKLIYGKVKPATLLKCNFFIEALQGFGLQISSGNFQNTFFQNNYSDCFLVFNPHPVY